MTRISSLPGIGQCPGFAVLRAAGDDTGSAAANTGSAVGRIAELWHRGGEGATSFEEAVAQAMREVAENFPRADMDEARLHALGYASDPRNRGVVVAEWCELEVKLTLAPAPEDPTGQPIELVGHIDQIRRDPVTKQLRVWDLKNGRPGGLELLYGYAWQIAAYSLACTATLGEPVLPGGVIRMKGYGTKRRDPDADPSTHFEAPWSLDQCRGMLDVVAFEVAHVRNGAIAMRPGMHCMWCPAGGPHLCGARLRALPTIPKGMLGMPQTATQETTT